MNRLENWFCASSFWRNFTERRLLPGMLDGCDLGDHVLELGAGFGAATSELRRRAPRVTSLEYDRAGIPQIAARNRNGNGAVVQGDAAALPFAAESFTAAIAILMLHHLRSGELQDRAFAEIRRVLKPGGVFLAGEINAGWPNRVAHFRSTFVPVDPVTVSARLKAAGFSSASVDFQRGGFRVRALRGGAE
jgi:ubiquinone/menaquinone biosynthesis C-methylase UbiE